MTKKVCIIESDHLYDKMFLSVGWTLVTSPEEADLICFTGGEDVTPALYGHQNIASNCNWLRDVREKEIYDAYVGKIPFVGVCRGGQFLNVMNGGLMFQHVDNHGIGGTHEMVNDLDQVIHVTSTHHQMMRPSGKGEIIGEAGSRATQFIAWDHPKSPMSDTEVVWYEETQSLCFQPHPEYRGAEETKKAFFDYIDRYIDFEKFGKVAA